MKINKFSQTTLKQSDLALMWIKTKLSNSSAKEIALKICNNQIKIPKNLQLKTIIDVLKTKISTNELLSLSTVTGNCEVIKIILKDFNPKDRKLCLKSYLNNQTDSKLTPLHVAADNGFSDVIKTLLNDFNQEDRKYFLEKEDIHGSTPLHMAAWENHKIAIETLITLGSNENKKDLSGLSPKFILENPFINKH